MNGITNLGTLSGVLIHAVAGKILGNFHAVEIHASKNGTTDPEMNFTLPIYTVSEKISVNHLRFVESALRVFRRPNRRKCPCIFPPGKPRRESVEFPDVFNAISESRFSSR